MEDFFSLLRKYGIKVADYEIVKTKKELLNAFERIKPPVVLKIWDEKYSHKTDIGGIILDIWNREMLINSYSHMKEKFGDVELLIQKQMKSGIEMYVGMKKDKTFGNMILFGLGGIYVEVFKDITYRICPLEKEDFYDMVEELRSKKILLGYRGKKIKLEELKKIVMKLCKLAEQENVEEIDLNPVKVNEKEAYVLDVRIKRRENNKNKEN